MKKEASKILLFELNEVPWKVALDYCKKFPDSTFAKIVAKSYKYETVCPDTGELSPWITWPTFHRGVNNEKHHISDFNQDLSEANKKYPSVWEILKHKGISTGVFGSFHSTPPPADYKDYSFFVPDAFSADSRAYPEYIEPFQNFNLVMSRGSSRNVSSKIDMKSGLGMVMKIPQLGLRMSTFMELGRHLIDERKRPWVKARRRTYQVVLAFDVFFKLIRKKKPQFVTFFSNHVASAMHRYWAASYPEDYKQYNIEKDWADTYKGEINFTMGVFDKFLKEMVSFIDANPDYKLVIASSMGQASTTADLIDSQVYIKDADKFFNRIGIPATETTKVASMFPQYNIKINAVKVETLRNGLKDLRINGQHVEFREQEGGFFAIDFGQKNIKEEFATLGDEKISFEELGLENMMIEDKSGSTAYHIPEGIMVIYDPKDLTAKEGITKIPSTAVAPALLYNFGLDIPEYMSFQPIKGLA